MTTSHSSDGVSYTTIGPYVIIDKLGQGGMATVYRAYHKMGGHAVALKVLSAHFSDQQEFRMRFEREALMLLEFEHPHILPVYDYGEDQNTLYLVMQLLDGRSLADILTEKPLPHYEIGRYTRQIASALDYAHARGVIHRDIKPPNILLDLENVPLLADFGVAYATAPGDRLTSAGAFVGTAAYASPEQCRGEAPDRRSDIYALAVLVFQMATGRLPFASTSALAMIKMHLTEKPPNPLAYNPGLPLAMYEVTTRGLAKNADDRYPSAMKFSEAVDAALNLHVLPEVDSREDWLVGDLSPVTFDSTSPTQPSPPKTDRTIPLDAPGAYRPTEEATAPSPPRPKSTVDASADELDTDSVPDDLSFDDEIAFDDEPFFDDDITLDDDFTSDASTPDPPPDTARRPAPKTAPSPEPRTASGAIRPLTTDSSTETTAPGASRALQFAGITILVLVVLVALIVIALTQRGNNHTTRTITRDDPTLGVSFDYPADWQLQIGFAAILTDYLTATIAVSDQPVLIGQSYAGARLVIALQRIDPVDVYNVPMVCQAALETSPQETFACMAREGHTTPVYEVFVTDAFVGVKLPGTIPPTPASVPTILFATVDRSWLAIMIVHWDNYGSAHDMLDAIARSVQ